MAALEFNWFGYEYQDGIQILRRSFEVGENALRAEVERAYNEIDAYDKKFPDGNDPSIVYDDNGCTEFDPRDHLIYTSLMLERAQASHRKAFAITLYHHWERGAREWSNKMHGKSSSLIKAVQDIGVAIDPKIVDISVLVNTLKHNASIWGWPLYEMRPDWFSNSFKPDRQHIDWFDSVLLQDAAMDEIFQIVSDSGPNFKTTMWQTES